VNEPTVFIVDDDEPVLRALSLLMRSVGHRVQTHTSARSFLDEFDLEFPGCLVADVRMEGVSGLELLEELKRRGSAMPVIIITGHGDVSMAVQAMKNGAFDFLQKPFEDTSLLERIQKALDLDTRTRREAAKSREVVEKLNRLSPRELQVVRLVVDGMTSREIGEKLGLSRKTVEIHRSHAMMKLGASSLADVVRIAVQHGVHR
jgi:RNA polymerase sigma factor (sigma-70 family)